MRKPKPVVVDFESFGIESRPAYPPFPVGVSIKYPGKKARYYGFGHLAGNNSSWDEAWDALYAAWTYARTNGVLFQNGKFDVDIAETHMGMPPLPWECVHDSMFLIFLDDPHAYTYSLKPSAERILGLPPDEQDAIKDWLIANQPIPGVKISISRQSDQYYARYIALAPGELVGTYANGDTDRTGMIFDKLWPDIVERGMLEAYDRERQLMPILLTMERQGIPVDVKALEQDIVIYEEVRERVAKWIVRTLRAPKDINLASSEQLVDAMVKAGKASPEKLGTTKTGKLRANKEALLEAVTDKNLLSMLKYYRALKTCLDTFMHSWAEMATSEGAGGRIYTTWNQVKSEEGADEVGAKTGRLSAKWFMNMPKRFQPLFAHEEKDRAKAKLLPKLPLKDLPSLPMCRKYIIPWQPGWVLLDRDYSQQEPRILAHYDGKLLLQKYLENPWIDFHDFAKAALESQGIYYDRRPVKDTNLGLIYGMGVGKLAKKTGLDMERTKQLKKAVTALYPGLKDIYADTKQRALENRPIATWGGRQYYCEKPAIDEASGRMMSFEYKMPNKLIQGSAADCTKEALIRYWNAKDPDDILYLTAHDEILISTPPARAHVAMERLRESMEGVEFRVPMLSEGKWSYKSWADLTDYDKKGVEVYGNKPN